MSNVPSILDTVDKWADVAYLAKQLGSRKYLTEYSENNHFMYFTVRGRPPKGGGPPVRLCSLGCGSGSGLCFVSGAPISSLRFAAFFYTISLSLSLVFLILSANLLYSTVQDGLHRTRTSV